MILGEFSPFPFKQTDLAFSVDVGSCKPCFLVVSAQDMGKPCPEVVVDVGTFNFGSSRASNFCVANGSIQGQCPRYVLPEHGALRRFIWHSPTLSQLCDLVCIYIWASLYAEVNLYTLNTVPYRFDEKRRWIKALLLVVMAINACCNFEKRAFTTSIFTNDSNNGKVEFDRLATPTAKPINRNHLEKLRPQTSLKLPSNRIYFLVIHIGVNSNGRTKLVRSRSPKRSLTRRKI